MAKLLFGACAVAAALMLGVGSRPVAAKDKPKEKPPEISTVVYEAGRYSARVPGRSAAFESREYATAAGPLKLNTERWDVSRDLSLSVTWCDYPESFESLDPAALLEAVRDGLRGKDGVVKRESAFHDGGLAGREYRIEAGKNVLRARVAVEGRRLYQLLIAGNAERVAQPAADEFFRSFELRK